MLFVSFQLSLRLSSMHSSSALRCWQVLQCVSVKNVQISHLAAPPLPHPVATSSCTLCSHSFELGERESLHRNLFEIMEENLKTERSNNMRGDNVCEWREVIHILQTDKLVQQQWQADRAGDRQKPRQSFWLLWLKCWKGKWKLCYSLIFFICQFPSALFISSVQSPFALPARLAVPPQKTLISLQLSVNMQDHPFFSSKKFHSSGWLCAAAAEHQLLPLRSVTEIDLTHRCCCCHPLVSCHLI